MSNSTGDQGCFSENEREAERQDGERERETEMERDSGRQRWRRGDRDREMETEAEAEMERDGSRDRQTDRETETGRKGETLRVKCALQVSRECVPPERQPPLCLLPGQLLSFAWTWCWAALRFLGCGYTPWSR